MTAVTQAGKKIGIVLDTNWDAPRVNCRFWHVLSGIIQNETLSLDDIETAFEEFTYDGSEKTTDAENAKAFLEWFRNYARNNGGKHETFHIKEEVGVADGKRIGIVMGATWGSPDMHFDFWAVLSRYAQNESLDGNAVDQAYQEVVKERYADEVVASAKAFRDWFRAHYSRNNYASYDAVGIVDDL